MQTYFRRIELPSKHTINAYTGAGVSANQANPQIGLIGHLWVLKMTDLVTKSTKWHSIVVRTLVSAGELYPAPDC